MVHDAFKNPEDELGLALVHHNARHDEVHALAVADVCIVQTEGPVHNQQHLLPLPQVHVCAAARLRRALRLLHAAALRHFLRIYPPGGELRSALEEAVLGERAMDVAPDLVADVFFQGILQQRHRSRQRRGDVSEGTAPAIRARTAGRRGRGDVRR